MIDRGLVVFEPLAQNSYPDFTLMKDEADPRKIAIDVKTTYRHYQRDGTWRASFTLGGYTSFLRKERKNIAFPYSQYVKHYIIGFIYTRVDGGQQTQVDTDKRIFSLEDVEGIPSPIKDVEFFVQEKHRIAADHPGSGNTTNIASITASSVQDFASGVGPFTSLGEDVFADYWRHYGKGTFQNLREYKGWKSARTS